MATKTGVSAQPPATASRPFRVLHVLDHSMPVMSGYSVRSRSLISGQARNGFKATVLTGPLHEFDDPESVDTDFDGVEYLRTKLNSAGLSGRVAKSKLPVIKDLAVIAALEKSISKCLASREFDVVHAHSPALCGTAAARACRKHGVPFVYEIRAFWEDAAVDQGRLREGSPKYRATRALETRVVRNADAVVGIASHILKDLAARGIDPSKLFHVSNGVDVNRFKPLPRDDDYARQIGLDGKHTFAFFGSLYRYEGIKWVISAMAELRKHSQEFNFLIVGSGEEEQQIREEIDRVNASSYIRQIDRVPFEKVGQAYSVVDTIVLPRLRVRITELVTPLKPLEAMAQNKLVLGSDVGGIRELVQHESTGLLFKAGDISSFVEQALRAVNDRSLYDNIIRQARTEVLQNFDWTVLARRYEPIYRYAVSHAQRAR